MEKLSKQKLKFFSSLKLKKNRDKEQLFFVEGEKAISDFIESGLPPKIIISSKSTLNSTLVNKNTTHYFCDKASLKKISALKTSPDTIAYFKMPVLNIDFEDLKNNISIFCDDIQNPGNLGTIIRTAEWFGVKQIFCSRQTVDAYNPKVVQATMGSLARMQIHYVDTTTFFENIKPLNLSILGSFMTGENIYTLKQIKSALLIMGNEGQGISSETTRFVTQKITIPRFSASNKPESLNVAVASSVILGILKS